MKIKIPYSYIQEYLPSKKCKKSHFAFDEAELEYEFEDFSDEMFPVAYSFWDAFWNKFEIRYGEGVFWKKYTEDFPDYNSFWPCSTDFFIYAHKHHIEEEYIKDENHIEKDNDKEEVEHIIREFIENRNIICIENELYVPIKKYDMCLFGLKIHMPELFPAILDSEYDVPNNGKTWEDF